MTALHDHDHDHEVDEVRSAPVRPAHLVFIVLLLLLAAAVGVVIGQHNAPSRALADPVSIGFARDMQTHHAQAVAMSTPIHRRSDDPSVTTLAFDILSTQQGQIGIMDGWLSLSPDADTSNASSDETPMAWMGEPHDGLMPGMATAEQVASLDTLPIAQATEQYLRLMIRHHRAALPMAQYAAEHAEQSDVRTLAQNMYDAQASEITVLQNMLTHRGHAPEPEADGSPHDGMTMDPADPSGAGSGHGSHG